MEHFDVVIVGAGLAGIAAAYRLQTRCPERTFVILEARESSGGTWDLFRYPGVRSDSDMHTLGFPFRPWSRPETIADAADILDYLQTTAHELGIDRKMRFRHRVQRASWSSAAARWTLTVARGTSQEQSETLHFSCNFLLVCGGYYRYDRGYVPTFAHQERYGGRIVSPQHWPADLDCTAKRVVVVGSGATAITLVPQLARHAGHVTMLQRSPSYVVALPRTDGWSRALRAVLPERWLSRVLRYKYLVAGTAWFRFCQLAPGAATRVLRRHMRRQLGEVSIDAHFTPRYRPWQQRLCVAADGDFFAALRRGQASVVTDQIEAFTPNGIRTASGTELEADVVVMATGLEIQLLGGVELMVDGQCVEPSQCVSFRGMMFSDVPNLAAVFGYSSSSWTLKADLTARYVCRLLNFMQRRGLKQCTPRLDASFEPQTRFYFTPGYVRRAARLFPRQGKRSPWAMQQNYLREQCSYWVRSVTEPQLEFAPAKKPNRPRCNA